MKNSRASGIESEGLKEFYSLESFDLLSPNELDFILKLASEICETKVALVSLIDSQGFVFRSHSSMDFSTISRNVFLISNDKQDQERLFIVEDATKDHRFTNNPLVHKHPHISFIASLLLITKEGSVLGALSILDTKPKTLALHQKAALDSLARLVASLYESKQNATQLDMLCDQLNTNKEQTEELVYSIAHDLKSPLDTIRGFLELLRYEFNTKPSSEVQEQVDYAIQSTKKMTEVINEILKFTKIISVKNEEKVNVEELIQDVLELNQPLIKAENVEIEYKHLPIITTSKTLLSILFRNLIGNALKYKSVNRFLKIKIAVEDKTDFWLIKIEDNGIGVHKSNMENIFRPFFRENSHATEGVGMGLATCKKIIKNLGGEIWLDSELGKGSSFQFSIPK